jgi:ATPase
VAYVIDVSVVVERAVSRLIKEGRITGRVLLPRVVLAELEFQALNSQETGLIGLEELQEVQSFAQEGVVDIELFGEKSKFFRFEDEVRAWRVASFVRDIAYNESAVLVTANNVQASSAKALGIEVIEVDLELKEKIEIEEFFDGTTMSVHLKDGAIPVAKKGKPGQWNLVDLEDTEMDVERVQKIAKEIVEKAKSDKHSFVEISRHGSTIVQYGKFRIVIVKPPLANGWEITAVTPLVKLGLDDYVIPDKVRERLEKRSSGIIVAGEVGSGKSTFASAVAEFYAANGKITKTIESPRDLVLSNKITQYSKNFGTSEEIHDILFLARPDNVLFDEIRDSPDFVLFKDIRLGGSSVIGVLHAASPIDTVQRFIGRIDVGTVPSILDTIIFISKGVIEQVLTLVMRVKVPSGMQEKDLARPVVEVIDLVEDKLLYEIYSYGEETVVIPVEGNKSKSPADKFAEKQIKKELEKYCKIYDLEMVSSQRVRVYVAKKDKARFIGAKGVNIAAVEKRLGISIDVKVQEEPTREELERLSYHVTERGRNIVFKLKDTGLFVDVFVEDVFLFSSTTSKKGELRVNMKSDIGEKLLDAFDSDKKVILKG